MTHESHTPQNPESFRRTAEPCLPAAQSHNELFATAQRIRADREGYILDEIQKVEAQNPDVRLHWSAATGHIRHYGLEQQQMLRMILASEGAYYITATALARTVDPENWQDARKMVQELFGWIADDIRLRNVIDAETTNKRVRVRNPDIQETFMPLTSDSKVVWPHSINPNMNIPDDWTSDMACREQYKEVLNAHSEISAKGARLICRSCEVVDDCLDHVLSNEDVDNRQGIASGLTPMERGLVYAIQKQEGRGSAYQEAEELRRQGLIRALSTYKGRVGINNFWDQPGDEEFLRTARGA